VREPSGVDTDREIGVEQRRLIDMSTLLHPRAREERSPS
jgi:hypothetical protein